MGRYISNTNTNSYQDNELLLLKQGIAKNHKEFLTAGTNTWTIDRVVTVRVRVWGGGGGGGGGFFASAQPPTLEHYVPGGGGGAGGAAMAILRLNAGTYNITIGAGGTAGKGSSGVGGNITLGTNGGNGGSSSFHTFITCSGGLGGSLARSERPVLGGAGGLVTFKWSGVNRVLYKDFQFGGVGGSFRPGYFANTSDASLSFQVGYGSEGGAGESGGPAGYALRSAYFNYTGHFNGGGGGGYNAPFIYGSHMRAQANSGRGVGTGGAGGVGGTGDTVERAGFAGNSGGVVIEWN